MIYFKTHIIADEASPRSGVVYTREILEKIANLDSTIPGAFGINIDDKGINESVIDVLRNRSFDLKGFDLIDGALYLKIDADEETSNKITDGDYIARLIIDGRFDVKKQPKELVEIFQVKAVVLLEEKK